eukprot:1724402-Karenia_brevis.AAC.1
MASILSGRFLLIMLGPTIQGTVPDNPRHGARSWVHDVFGRFLLIMLGRPPGNGSAKCTPGVR